MLKLFEGLSLVKEVDFPKFVPHPSQVQRRTQNSLRGSGWWGQRGMIEHLDVGGGQYGKGGCLWCIMKEVCGEDVMMLGVFQGLKTTEFFRLL